MKPITITLAYPILRGEKPIEAITLRKPKTGELRGLKRMDLLQLDEAQTAILLTRISEPALTEVDIADMDIVDSTKLMVEVLAFFTGAPSPNASMT